MEKIKEITVAEKTLWTKKFENDVAIAPQTLWIVPISENEEFKYGIFNLLTAFNFSSLNAEIRFEGSTSKAIMFPTGSVRKKAVRFYKVHIYNRSTTTSIPINKIIVEVEKTIPLKNG